MRFSHRIRNVWSWLPAFRAVAETEHLPTAAHALGVVPSSLSRMIKLFEDDLGIALFDRTAKTLVLNDSGRTVLGAVREAMRIIDEALTSVVGDELRGSIGGVATGELARLVLVPASAALARANPGLVVTTTTASSEDAAGLLLRGEADVALITEAPPIHPDLRVVELATWTRSVYARPGHIRRDVTRCAVVGAAADHADDGWPATCERVVAAWVPDERAALELCRDSDLVTVAYDPAVTAYGLANQLERVPDYDVAARVVRLIHRRPVGRHRRTEVLIEAIKAAIAR
jgi:DNA-binding transcriptional LysR family regulator